jgi:hypothetical protein
VSTVSFEEGLHDLCQAHGLNAVYLFGPDAGGKGGAPSDARVGLIFRETRSPAELAALHPKLLAAFRDLMGTEGLQLVFLQQAGPSLQYQGILGRLLYSADATRRAEFEERVVRDHLDFAFEIRLFDEELAEEMDRETGKG